ncbi:MAG: hypothetical protein H7A26_07120 [Spirochaetales bacterium]|nr:hypothetical protein [Spirochaetales bacterium]
MDLKKTVSILFALLISAHVCAIELEGANIHKKLIEMTDASAPVFVDDYILFTFKSSEKTSFVGAAFDFSNFTKVYQYKRTPEGIYFLVIQNPGNEIIKYRLIVDGLWMPDPFNSEKVRGINTVEVSILRQPEKPDSEINYPRIEDGYTNFFYKGETGISVYLSGSFNGWDPFMYLLSERRPGEYYISLKLPPGKHNYYYVVNGKIIPDRRNPNVVWDKDFREISTFTIRHKE